MPIRRLRITSLRNILTAELEPVRFNLLCGVNGSGKTSILEAVYLLGSGRSFRSVRLDPVIQHEAPQCTVHAVLAGLGDTPPSSVGVTRHRNGDFEGRINGRPVRSAAELARSLPALLINAETFDLLAGAPKVRRQFIDWGVFHVEPAFHLAWQQAMRSVRQRNMLLRRDNISAAEISAWNDRFVSAAEELDEMRRRYFDAFYPLFRQALSEVIDLDGLELSYSRGWDRERSLASVLEDQLHSDRQRGFTHSGPHRADMRARMRGVDAVDVLSRGQQKLVVSAMKLAQARLLQGSRAEACVFLIDDLPAELDRAHRKALCAALTKLDCQVLITCVDAGDLAGCWQGVPDRDVRTFHVEQGAVALLNQEV